MALNLDARQRAMLDAMGITVWLPDPAAPPPQPASIQMANTARLAEVSVITQCRDQVAMEPPGVVWDVTDATGHPNGRRQLTSYVEGEY